MLNLVENLLTIECDLLPSAAMVGNPVIHILVYVIKFAFDDALLYGLSSFQAHICP